jgi:predicted RNA-binding protein YlxR (DUF448 family)
VCSTDTVRTCVGCRKRDSSANLLRTVVSVGDTGTAGVVPDPGRRAPGRGAHLHPTTECLDLAERRKAFPRALRTPGPLTLILVREYVEQHGSTKDATVSP